MSSCLPAERAAPHRGRRAGAWLVLALTFATGACKDDPVRATDDVAGTWTAVNEDGARQYLRIAPEEIEVFSEDLLADCFDRALYEIVEIDGDEFRLSDSTHSFTIELRRDGEELQVTAFDHVLNYDRTANNPSTLPECSVPNPGVACVELPPLIGPGTEEGSLALTDPENPDGSHYDLYRLEVGAPMDLLLEMRSSEIDSYLLLFQDGSGVVIENDDASSLTLNARIDATLEAGCYIVMATSAGPFDFGDYIIELSTP